MRLIHTADWHLSVDIPRCRLDEDWEGFQESIIDEIVGIANKNKAMLAIGGDIFNTPNVPSRMVIMLMEKLLQVEKGCVYIFGNHDLPHHNIQNIKNSSCGLVEMYSNISDSLKPPEFAQWSHFGDDEKNKDSEMVFTHRLVFPDLKSMPPNADAVTAAELLKEYPKAKWILTGDMHTAFHYEKNNRHVINPGCIIRHAADYKDYKPSVFFIDTEKDIVKQIFLADTAPMVDDSYLRNAEEREDRIGAFVEKIQKNESISLSILDNLKNAIEKNKKTLGKKVIQVIEEFIEEAS